MNWHVDPHNYEPVDCTHCLDHAGRPTGRDEHGLQCPICKGRRLIDPDMAPAPNSAAERED